MNLISVILMALTLNIGLQPKQMEAWNTIQKGIYKYYLYGGAKFGGKSYLVRASQIMRRLLYPETSSVIIRKTFDELQDNHIKKIRQEFPEIYKWYHKGDKEILFPNGSSIKFRYLKYTEDVYNYQGIEYDDICLDEATQHEEEVFKILKTSLRKDPKIAIKYPNYNPIFLLTGNPGGIGHGWVERLFYERDYLPKETPSDYGFLQALYHDNPIGVEQNPDYIRNLEDLPEDLRKAYLEGDWSVLSGQYFKKLRRDKHLIDPFPTSVFSTKSWVLIRSLDWGYDHHTVCLWWAANTKGDVFIYRYFKTREMMSPKLARTIVQMTPKDEDIHMTVASPDLWRRIQHDEREPETTVADLMARNGLYIEKANDSRVTGWEICRWMLEWNKEEKPIPKCRIFSNCEEVFKDLGRLIHDENNPEDVKKMKNDDTGDSFRYGAVHIYNARDPVEPKGEREKFIESIVVDRHQGGRPQGNKWGDRI